MLLLNGRYDIIQGRAAIDNFVAGMDGDRARRRKWVGLAAELDAEVKIVKVQVQKRGEGMMYTGILEVWMMDDGLMVLPTFHFYPHASTHDRLNYCSHRGSRRRGQYLIARSGILRSSPSSWVVVWYFIIARFMFLVAHLC